MKFDILFSEGDFAGVGPAFIYAGVTPGFWKTGYHTRFILFVLKGFKTVFNNGIDNGIPLYVAIIPNHDDNDSVVSYSHMRT